MASYSLLSFCVKGLMSLRQPMALATSFVHLKCQHPIYSTSGLSLIGYDGVALPCHQGSMICFYLDLDSLVFGTASIATNIHDMTYRPPFRQTPG